eukprot:COSAG01_NODE_32378_length_582_cov_1.598344_1_plen_71_part_01
MQYGQGQFDWEKIGIVACSDIYCHGLAENARQKLAESGITDVHEFGLISLGDSYLKSEVRRAVHEIAAWLE